MPLQNLVFHLDWCCMTYIEPPHTQYLQFPHLHCYTTRTLCLPHLILRHLLHSLHPQCCHQRSMMPLLEILDLHEPREIYSIEIRCCFKSAKRIRNLIIRLNNCRILYYSLQTQLLCPMTQNVCSILGHVQAHL